MGTPPVPTLMRPVPHAPQLSSPKAAPRTPPELTLTKPELPAPQPSSHQDAPKTPPVPTLMPTVPHAPQLVVLLKDASKTPPESGSPLTELPAHQTDPSLNMPELPDF